MQVRKLCQQDVVTVRPTDEIGTAARLMREKHIGFLVVVEPDATGQKSIPVGVVTDRDIVVSVVAADADPHLLRVGDVMTREPSMIAESDELESALLLMRKMGVRRLPVVGAAGELVGVLSIDNVIEALAWELQNVAGSIRTQQCVESVLRP